MSGLKNNNSFYSDDSFCNREHCLFNSIVNIPNSLHPESIRHLKRGFNYRLGMMEHSRIFLRDHTQTPRSTPSPDLLTSIQIHLNVYYLNIRGALDNLAWGLNYELGLFSDIDESTGRGQNRINLFESRYRRAVGEKNDTLKQLLDENNSWERSLKRWRDPAGHRVPLFVPGSVLTSEKEMQEFQRLDDLSGKEEHELQGRRRIEIILEARKVGTFLPMFWVEDCAGEPKPHSIPDQVGNDHEHFLTVSEAVFCALGLMQK